MYQEAASDAEILFMSGSFNVNTAIYTMHDHEHKSRKQRQGELTIPALISLTAGEVCDGAAVTVRTTLGTHRSAFQALREMLISKVQTYLHANEIQTTAAVCGRRSIGFVVINSDNFSAPCVEDARITVTLMS